MIKYAYAIKPTVEHLKIKQSTANRSLTYRGQQKDKMVLPLYKTH